MGRTCVGWGIRCFTIRRTSWDDSTGTIVADSLRKDECRMSTTKEWPAIGADAAPIERATVIAVDTSPEHIRVRCLTDEHEVITCDVLQAPARGQPVHLAAGDWALVWRPGHEGDLAVVLGRIGREPPALASAAPAEVVLEAERSLTLRVAAGA